MEIKDGGAAFPSDQPQILVPHDLPREWVEKIHQIAGQTKGMTLRDWFAGQALTGLCSRDGYDNHPRTQSIVATMAIDQADALIEQLAARGETK